MNILFAALGLIDKKETALPQISADQDSDTLGRALTLTFVIIGAMALMLFVIAGFRYVVSGGDPQKTADAKRMIIYTAVGLIVAASAVLIVNVVLGQVR